MSDHTLKSYITTIPDFPKKGIMFRDITSLLQHPDGFCLAIDCLQACLEDVEFDMIATPESRGFIFGVPLADRLHKGIVPVRKAGKLPRETISKSYTLEYTTTTIEIHKDAIVPGQRVVIVDDLLATGGTVKAAAELIEELGGTVAKIITLIELPDLNGRQTFEGYDYESVVQFEGE